jgi:hypothetical protein
LAKCDVCAVGKPEACRRKALGAETFERFA